MNHLVKRLDVKGNSLFARVVCVLFFFHLRWKTERWKEKRRKRPLSRFLISNRCVLYVKQGSNLRVVTILQVEYNYPLNLYGNAHLPLFLIQCIQGSRLFLITQSSDTSEEQKKCIYKWIQIAIVNIQRKRTHKKIDKKNTNSSLWFFYKHLPNENYYTISRTLFCAKKRENFISRPS